MTLDQKRVSIAGNKGLRRRSLSPYASLEGVVLAVFAPRRVSGRACSHFPTKLDCEPGHVMTGGGMPQLPPRPPRLFPHRRSATARSSGTLFSPVPKIGGGAVKVLFLYAQECTAMKNPS